MSGRFLRRARGKGAVGRAVMLLSILIRFGLGRYLNCGDSWIPAIRRKEARRAVSPHLRTVKTPCDTALPL